MIKIIDNSDKTFTVLINDKEVFTGTILEVHAYAQINYLIQQKK